MGPLRHDPRGPKAARPFPAVSPPAHAPQSCAWESLEVAADPGEPPAGAAWAMSVGGAGDGGIGAGGIGAAGAVAPLAPATVLPRAAAWAGMVPAGPAPLLDDPDLADPRIAAERYRALFAEIEVIRSALEERSRAGKDELAADAQRHRDAAEVIRAKVDEVWESISGPLAQHGLSDLDQLRPRPGAGPPGASTPAVSLREPVSFLDDRGRPVARVGRRAGAGRREARPPVRAGPPRPHAAPVDPDVAPRVAYRHCHEAMSQAAELRAISRGRAAVSAGLVAGFVCLLAGGLTALARLSLDVAVLPCLGVAGLLGWLAVTSVTDGGRLMAVRSGIVAAGSAGLAVLATLRLGPAEPVELVDVAAALAAVALAIRFGLGFGAVRSPGAGEKSPGRPRGRPR